MIDTQAIKGIRRALSRREHAEELQRSATHDLREWARVAHKDGLCVARIAREAGLSRECIRELLTKRPAR
jgi:hypothetical protein